MFVDNNCSPSIHINHYIQNLSNNYFSVVGSILLLSRMMNAVPVLQDSPSPAAFVTKVG